LTITANHPTELIKKLEEAKFETIKEKGSRKRNGPKLAVIQGKPKHHRKNEWAVEQWLDQLGIKVSQVLSIQTPATENSLSVNDFLNDDRMLKKAGQWLLLDCSGEKNQAIDQRCANIGYGRQMGALMGK